MSTSFNVKVKIDLIEWYVDDVGQYQEQGLPRSLDCLKLFIRADELTDDAIGEEILSLLEKSYRIKPVLVS